MNSSELGQLAPHPTDSQVTKASYRLTMWTFHRALAFVYLLAFLSLYPQIHGLVGQEGVLPAGSYLDRAAATLGSEFWRRFPLLSFFGASDGCLHAYALLGIAASVAALLGFVSRLAFLLAWGCYLCLALSGQVFLHFQWDQLLLESGLLAVFSSPLCVRDRMGAQAERPLLRLLWLALLFRLMFSAGFVKLDSGDEAWRSLTALSYHYQSQPLPNPLSWLAHALPMVMQRLSCGLMFVIELLCPFLIWRAGPARRWAVLGLMGLQLVISLTGNYGFFNLLAAILCLPCLPDEEWRQLNPWLDKLWPRLEAADEAPVSSFDKVTVGVFLVLAISPFSRTLGWRWSMFQPLHGLHSFVAPARSVNAYGLFAVMTKERFELEIELSVDGERWHRLDCPYKLADVNSGPAFCGPHMPRLDWLMWFAALSEYQHNNWFLKLMKQLMRGRQGALSLFPEQPSKDLLRSKRARFMRVRRFRYQFSYEGSAWWQREEMGAYAPELHRGEDGQLRFVRRR